MSIVSDFDRPIFGPPSLFVASVGLLKKHLLPVADIGFSKMSKHFRILDTFCTTGSPNLVFLRGSLIMALVRRQGE
jgi:hypothetical protein